MYFKTCNGLYIENVEDQVSRNVLINMYFSFIRPVLESADIVWDNCISYESYLRHVEAGITISGLRSIQIDFSYYMRNSSLYIILI